MFSSRIMNTAQSLGAAVKLIRDPNKLADEPGRQVIVDLNQEGAIAAAADWKESHGGPVIGFVSHVDVEIIELARQAGIDQILPRSRFVQILPELL